MRSGRIRMSVVVFGVAVIVLGLGAQSVLYGEVIPINQIAGDKVESVVTIKGKITNTVPPPSDRAPYSYYVDDGTEVIRVVIWRNIYGQIKDPAKFKSDEEVEITGRVKSFRGSLEVHLIGPTGIKLASEAGKTIETLAAAVATSPTAAKPSAPQSPTAVTVKIGDINQTFLNKKVAVEGSVTAYRESTFERAPNTITLTDEGKSIPVVFWQEVSSKLTPEQKPERGKKLKVVGRAIQHNDTLQIKVYEVGDIHVVAK